MPQNVSGINSANVLNSIKQAKLSNAEKTNADDTKVKTSVEETDESEYVDIDFTNMSLDEVSDAAESLEQDMMLIKVQMDGIKALLEADEAVKQGYEQEYNSKKEQIEKLNQELKQADTPEEKAKLKTKVFTLSQSLELLYSQIQAALDTINDHNAIKSNLNNEFSAANQSYQRAISAQNKKEAEQLDLQKNYATSNVPGLSGVSGTSSDYSSAPKGASSGKVSNNMLNALKNWEGLRTSAYQCAAGVWTIGYGHTKGVSPGQQISEARAEAYLKQDLASFENEVTQYANEAGVKLSQGQYDALVSLAFNCGGGVVKSSGILQMLKSGNIDAAASKMKEYCHGGGRVLQGLVNRRAQEAQWLYT